GQEGGQGGGGGGGRGGGEGEGGGKRGGRGGAAGRAPAAGVIVPEAPPAVPDAVPAVEMAADEHAQALAGAAARLLVDLQAHALEGDGVIRGDGARLFVTEDVGEVDPAEGHEGRGRIGGGVGKARLIGGEEALVQVAIGRGHGGDAGGAELIDEAVLEGPVEALAAAAGLGRVG